MYRSDAMMLLVGTGTNVGKTLTGRALAAAWRRQGREVAALKPIETGCQPDALDALALAEACARPELATAPGFYRARQPLAPYACEMQGEPALDVGSVVAATQRELRGAEAVVVESAGGLLVPLTRTQTNADFARALGLPLVLIARDELGVLSNVLAYLHVVRSEQLSLRAVVLTRSAEQRDLSTASNARILRERLDVEVCTFEFHDTATHELAAAAMRSGLAALI